MKIKTAAVRGLIGQGLLYTLILNSMIAFVGELSPAQAQRRVIVVNADQPNVWTLEQAHYLLAQMHRRNLDLRAKKLEDLDANEINGLRFDVLRQLIEFGATFNQADRLANQILTADKTNNAERRRTLISHRDKLHAQSLDLTSQISQLKIDKARAKSDEETARLDEEIAARTTELEKVDKEIEFDDNELKALGDGSGELKSTTGGATFNPEKLPTSTFEKAFEDAMKAQIAEFNKPGPKLNATLRLENFLQMQYEIIAKQLTLLRDEVGPGERLLFLEMPQTVNVTHHEADKKWAQSWWRISGYIRNCREYQRTLRMSVKATIQNVDPCSASTASADSTQDARPTPSTPKLTPQLEQREEAQTKREEDVRKRITQKEPPEPTSRRTERILKFWDQLRKGASISNLDEQYVSLQGAQNGNAKDTLQLNDPRVRTVELIPRQSSLNVNDMKLRTRAGAFNFALSTLFGFGSSLNVQRQREQFSQFVQQELYSAAFGKGSREFGWTFTAMPGMDRLQSGVRTTYAVVVVPEEASYLVLQSNGCYFPRSQYQPNDFDDTLTTDWTSAGTSRHCGDPKAFLVPIPVGASGQNDFFVQGLTYESVKKGERIVVLAYGYNFSAQTGVLINGSPLTPSIGMAQPLLLDDSTTGEKALQGLKDERVHGRIERVDSEQIVFSFEMPKDFEGTPDITFVAPGKAVTLNQLKDLYINHVPNTTLEASRLMFGKKPAEKESFRIDKVEVFRARPRGNLVAMVSGAGFEDSLGNSSLSQVLINGNLAVRYRVESPTLMRAEFPATDDETIRVTLISRNADPSKTQTIESTRVSNPAFLKVTSVTVVSYEPATEDEPGTLVVKIEGTGFSENLRSSIGELAVKSATEAFLKVIDPEAAAVVVFTDRQTGQQVKTIVTRKEVSK